MVGNEIESFNSNQFALYLSWRVAVVIWDVLMLAGVGFRLMLYFFFVVVRLLILCPDTSVFLCIVQLYWWARNCVGASICSCTS